MHAALGLQMRKAVGQELQSLLGGSVRGAGTNRGLASGFSVGCEATEEQGKALEGSELNLSSVLAETEQDLQVYTHPFKKNENGA